MPHVVASSDSWSTLIVVLGMAAVLPAVFLIAYLVEKKRTETLRMVASGMGFGFAEKGDVSAVGAASALHLCSRGRRKKLKNVMQGQAAGTHVTLFDYQYTIGSGKNSSTYKQTVMMFDSPGMGLPQFALRPERFFHKIGAAFGYQDIDFDDHPDFSKHYLLRGDDEAAIRTMFSSDKLSYFEHNHGLCAEGTGQCLVFYRHGKRADPKEIPDFVQKGVEAFTVLRQA